MAGPGSRPSSFPEYLLQRGLLTEDQIQTVWGSVAEGGGGFSAAVVAVGFLDERQVAEAVGEFSGVPWLALSEYLIDPVIARLVPEHLAVRHRLIAINKVGNRLAVAMADPTDIIAIDDLQLLTGLQVKPVAAAPSEIQQAIRDAYPQS